MYAKEFFGANKPLTDPGLCFVLMPFDPRFDPEWKLIKETAESSPFNLKCERADEFDHPGYVMTDVMEKIGEASLVIVVVNVQNPNVYYELGIAHSFKNSNQVVLISDSIDSVPFDLRPFRHFIYDGSLEKLKEILCAVISQSGIRQYDLKLKEGDTKKFETRLRGDDGHLYEIEIFAEYVGDDGVNFKMDLIRYAGGSDPEVASSNWQSLGKTMPAMAVPNMPWSICFKSINTKQVRFILGRAKGWEPGA
ncbi:MAG: hypothetical protein E6H07_00175 [Bacteroidetes bacterium]|nr:MAG: hypothetical protein E6H07_00175 [Bacteroidota bacterium]